MTGKETLSRAASDKTTEQLTTINTLRNVAQPRLCDTDELRGMNITATKRTLKRRSLKDVEFSLAIINHTKLKLRAIIYFSGTAAIASISIKNAPGSFPTCNAVLAGFGVGSIAA
jgi:hypothetical protein